MDGDIDDSLFLCQVDGIGHGDPVVERWIAVTLPGDEDPAQRIPRLEKVDHAPGNLERYIFFQKAHPGYLADGARILPAMARVDEDGGNRVVLPGGFTALVEKIPDAGLELLAQKYSAILDVGSRNLGKPLPVEDQEGLVEREGDKGAVLLEGACARQGVPVQCQLLYPGELQERGCPTRHSRHQGKAEKSHDNQNPCNPAHSDPIGTISFFRKFWKKATCFTGDDRLYLDTICRHHHNRWWCNFLTP